VAYFAFVSLPQSQSAATSVMCSALLAHFAHKESVVFLTLVLK
jgi:hypothetical protein